MYTPFWKIHFPILPDGECRALFTFQPGVLSGENSGTNQFFWDFFCCLYYRFYRFPVCVSSLIRSRTYKTPGSNKEVLIFLFSFSIFNEVKCWIIMKNGYISTLKNDNWGSTKLNTPQHSLRPNCSLYKVLLNIRWGPIVVFLRCSVSSWKGK